MKKRVDFSPDLDNVFKKRSSLSSKSTMKNQNLDEEAAATVASFYSIKSGLYRQRAKVLPPVPRTRADVDFTGSWTETTDLQQFLVVDSEDEDRILIFSTAEMLDILANAETIFMDGTSFVCPSLWQQVYIVHCLVDGQMFPVAFSLLPSKSRDTYIRLFNYMKDSVLAIVGVELFPSVVQTDYEAAAIGATERVFPDAEVRGCYFHFTQAVWRQVSEKGLVNTYKDNRAFNTHVRRAAALPLLPVDQIQDAWMEKLVQKHHPNIYEFVIAMKKLETTNRVARRQIEHGAAVRPRSRLYKNLDSRLHRLQQQLETGRRSPLQFLDAAGHLIKLN
ncbi:uncharacterized protein [Haliotis asinina]|uniref:uncharacterized protein n=1 Tax=Haliotis asinina TaxID=109174 RepID=UPI0035324A81